MSANDYILITKDNRVVHCDADVGPYDDGIQYDSLEEAVAAAQEICDRELVEYGISFERRTSQREAVAKLEDGK